MLLLAACSAEAPRVVSLSLPADTTDTVGPYVVEGELRGDADDTDLVVCWSVDGAHFLPAVAEPRAGRADRRAAFLPGQPAGTTVSYLVALVDTGAGCPAFDASATLRSFHIEASDSGACVFDSDCSATDSGFCAHGTCHAYDGACVDGACPGGLTCDDSGAAPVCVVATRPCTSDDDCPTHDECDLARGECTARP
jgi:hypothetical protein